MRTRCLAEHGVRFLEVLCPPIHKHNSPWHQRDELIKYRNEYALVTDHSVAVLIMELETRGLLDETVVI